MPRIASARVKRALRGRLEELMDCTVRIYRPTDRPSLNPTTGRVISSVEQEIYNGPARIWQTGDGGFIQVGDALIAQRITYVSIPWETAPVPHVEDLVEVQDSPVDPDLVGRVMRVMSIDGGGLSAVTRRMQVIAFSESSDWS